MPNIATIQVIYAADTFQRVYRLKEIVQQLKDTGCIQNFAFLADSCFQLVVDTFFSNNHSKYPSLL